MQEFTHVFVTNQRLEGDETHVVDCSSYMGLNATGETVTAALLNPHIRDNLLETSAATVTTAGDLAYADAANSMGSRLAIGAAETILTSTGTAPAWAGSGWADYTPAWTGNSPAIGNGILTGRFLQIAKLVVTVGFLQPGSTTTFGSGGTYFLSLPVTRAAESNAREGFDFTQGARINDNTDGLTYTMVSEWASATNIALVRHDEGQSAAFWSKSSPITLAQDDRVHWMLIYEAA